MSLWFWLANSSDPCSRSPCLKDLRVLNDLPSIPKIARNPGHCRTHSLAFLPTTTSKIASITSRIANPSSTIAATIYNTEHSSLSGGGKSAPAEHQQFELSDYRYVQERQRREDKTAAKRKWLEEQDEMKFSHSIQFNAVPDWSSHYIAYSNLKKL